MKRLFEFLNLRKTVTFEDVKIYHETDSSVLVELKNQTIWLQKKHLSLIRENGIITLVIPRWLLRKKFPPPKYNQFTDI